MVSLLLKKIERETEIKEVYIITNPHYYADFKNWLKQTPTGLDVRILQNNNQTFGQGQGWVKDLNHVVEEESIAEDVLVLAGDTIFGFGLGELIDLYREKGTDVLASYPAPWEDLHRRGIVVLDQKGRVDRYLEKPNDPPCNMAGIIAYILKKETLQLLPQAVDGDYNPELNLIQWLRNYNLREVYSLTFKERIDVGSPVDFFEVNNREPIPGWERK